ncbi:MAG: class I SAM-dependent methyltransferase [Bryobacterales bacterium]|nr:class I SAM-dependent methyltransferase [Bryobacteraceae bacterium]MDW8131711.1 class I SAM-dependent methyltransferase [Bryobacterales bacterium]
MRYRAIRRWLPRFLHRRLLAFEAAIEDAVGRFAAALPAGVRVLDAGAGEGVHARYFAHHRYVGVDLAVGDPGWDYSRLDVIADLAALPFPDGCFQACLNVVTLEHVREPARVLAELWRVLSPGGRLLLIVPQEWEIHQAPHDYFRFTRYGLCYLIEQAGFRLEHLEAAGGFFRLLARRLLNGLQFFRGPAFLLAALAAVPAALVLPWLDGLDRERNFTLGYVCTAVKP